MAYRTILTSYIELDFKARAKARHIEQVLKSCIELDFKAWI